MPESKKRKKAASTPSPTSSSAPRKKGPSPVWLPPLMLALFLIGILWLVVFYITEGELPVEAFGSWNLIAGFGFIIAGFVVSTQWR